MRSYQPLPATDGAAKSASSDTASSAGQAVEMTAPASAKVGQQVSVLLIPPGFHILPGERGYKPISLLGELSPRSTADTPSASPTPEGQSHNPGENIIGWTGRVARGPGVGLSHGHANGSFLLAEMLVGCCKQISSCFGR
jgi:hypothetical protein